MGFYRRCNRKLLRICTHKLYDRDKERELEENKMSALLDKIQKLNVSPQVARALGLEDNWKENISPEFIKTVAETAIKNEKMLKELSKY